MSTVTVSDKAVAVAALEEEKRKLFSDAAEIAKEQKALLKRFRDASNMHKAVLSRIIAIEETQAKLLVSL